MAHRSLSSLTLAALVLAAASASAADDIRTASTSQSENEAAVVATRLDAAVHRASNAELATADARAERRDLLDRAGDVRRELSGAMATGAVAPGLLAQAESLAGSLLMMADAAVADAANAVGGTGSIPPAASDEDGGDAYPQTATVVIRFRDVAGYATSVLSTLTDSERAEVRQLVQAGEDVVAVIKKIGRTDYKARDENLKSLSAITDKLQALYQTGLSDRQKGRDFIPAWRTPDGWLQVQQQASGLRALRVSFVKPGTAWLMLENTTQDLRPFFVEMEFYDAFGEVTGRASVESESLGELRPGEVRRVLVPMAPGHPRFWDVTKGFSVFLE